MKTLHVIRFTREEVGKEWGLELPTRDKGDVYARCNKDGIVNWDSTLVYEAHELVGRDNVKLIKYKGKE